MNEHRSWPIMIEIYIKFSLAILRMVSSQATVETLKTSMFAIKDRIKPNILEAS